MNVTLREKPLTKGKKSLYLDYYPPIINPQTGKQTRREFLSLHIFAKPKTDVEKEHNKQTRLLAENIRAKRLLEINAGEHGFLSKSHKKANFLVYFQQVIDGREIAAKTKTVWENSLLHFADFCGGGCSFEQVTPSLVEDFRRYILKGKSRRDKSRKLSQNTSAAYFEKFIAVINQAVKDKFLTANPATNVDRIKNQDTDREFLTLDELQKLAATKVKMPDVLRRAALFSALTGMRISDIENLKWENLRSNDAGEFYLQFVMQKTKENITLPIAAEARELMLEEKKKTAFVFEDMPTQSNRAIPLIRWTAAAGIDKHITFHSFRHTYATLQITLNTDIYTVSKLLGHKNLKTTQIYARVVDQKKREAANKISLK